MTRTLSLSPSLSAWRMASLSLAALLGGGLACAAPPQNSGLSFTGPTSAPPLTVEPPSGTGGAAPSVDAGTLDVARPEQPAPPGDARPPPTDGAAGREGAVDLSLPRDGAGCRVNAVAP